MKILKEGNVLKAENWKVRIICKKWDSHDLVKPCGAELEITEADLTVRYYKGTHFRHDYLASKCPLCGKHTPVFNVPSPIRERVLKEKGSAAEFDGVSGVC